MGTVSATMLVGINIYTAPLIAKNEELKLKSSILDVLKISYNRDNLEEIFNKNIMTKSKDKKIFYTGIDNAVVFEFYGPGLWGPIAGMISFNSDLKTIRSIKILHQEETPGLGSRIAEESFLSQFKDKEALPRLSFVPAGKSKAKNEIDAITGATMSSKALERLLNENIQKYITLLKKPVTSNQ
jgi:Na+-transporting NADH:ubiquinone oxidoreductase subunit C